MMIDVSLCVEFYDCAEVMLWWQQVVCEISFVL